MLKFLSVRTRLVLAVILVGICLFWLFPASNGNLRLSKKILMEGGICLLLILSLIKNPWMKAFLLWVLVRFAMALCPASYNSFIAVFFFIMFYQLIKDKIETKYLPFILNSVCILALVNIALMLSQACNWWMIIYPKKMTVEHAYFNGVLVHLKNGFWEYRNFITGFFGNSGDTAAYLALCFPAFFRKGWAWLIPLVLGGIWATKSMAAVICVYITILYFLAVYGGKYRFYFSYIWVLLGIWVCQFLDLFTELLTMNGRAYVWQEIWQNLIIKHPFIGIGLGNFYATWPPIHKSIGGHFSNERWTYAHNDYVQLWAELGLIGLVIAGGYLATVVYKGLKAVSHNRRVLFCGILVGLSNAFVNFTFHLSLIVVFLTYLAMFEKEVGL